MLKQPESRSHDPVEVAAEGLRLRAWVLRLLAEPPSTAPAPPPDVSPRAWKVMLSTERCALPVRSRARGRAGAEGDLTLLERFATTELTRVLSARAQLRDLDRVAAEGGWQPIVLKGGVVAGDRDPLDLMDLDLLLDRGHAPRFAEAMADRGYAADAPDRLGPDASTHHLAERRLPGAIQVEVHFRLPLMDDGAAARALTMGGARALRRLAPVDHAWHLLLHATVQHPFRRGRIRDLLLISRALAECDALGRAEVQRRVEAHPFSEPLTAVANAAVSLGSREPAPDPFRAIAAGNYVSQSWPPRPLLGRADDVGECLFAIIGGAQDLREVRAHVWHNPPRASELAAVARMERHIPLLGGALRRSIRAARYGVAFAGALPMARAAQAAVRRAGAA